MQKRWKGSTSAAASAHWPQAISSVGLLCIPGVGICHQGAAFFYLLRPQLMGCSRPTARLAESSRSPRRIDYKAGFVPTVLSAGSAMTGLWTTPDTHFSASAAAAPPHRRPRAQGKKAGKGRAEESLTQGTKRYT